MQFVCVFCMHCLVIGKEFEAKRFTNKGDQGVVKTMFNRLYGAGWKVMCSPPLTEFMQLARSLQPITNSEITYNRYLTDD